MVDLTKNLISVLKSATQIERKIRAEFSFVQFQDIFEFMVAVAEM